MGNDSIVSYKSLIKFFVPLMLSSLSITLTHFIMNISLGKLPDPDLYISAYNTARTLVLIFQSTGICMTFVVTAFVVNERTYRKVVRYFLGSITLLATVFLTVSFTPLSRIIFSELYNLTGDLLEKSITVFRFLQFFSLAVCIRTFFVGIALKLRYNPFITIASFSRLLVMIALNLLMIPLINNFNNDYLPGAMLMLCGITEAAVIMIAIFIYNRDLKTSVMNACKNTNVYNKDTDITYKQILVFSLPLILSFMMGKLVPGVTNSALALAYNNERVIAAYSIAMVVANMVGALMMGFQHLILNHDSLNEENRRILKRFAYMLGVFGCLLLCIVAYTPLGDYMLIDVLNTLPETAKLSRIMLRFMVLNPIFLLYTNYFNGYLLKIKKTKMLIFQRVFTLIIPYSLFFIIPNISWIYAAAMGGIVMSVCNLAAGGYNHIVFKYAYRKYKLANVAFQ